MEMKDFFVGVGMSIINRSQRSVDKDIILKII